MFYYHFHVDTEYAGNMNDYIVISDEMIDDEDCDKYLDDLSYENAEENKGYNLFEDDNGEYDEDEEEEYFENAYALGSWQSVTVEEAQRLVNDGATLLEYN